MRTAAQIPQNSPSQLPGPAAGQGVLPLYLIEAMATVGGTLLSIGIAFYMNSHFGWTMRDNFLFAAGQGLVYIPGALLAGPLTARFGKLRTLLCVYITLTALTSCAGAMANSGQGSSATWIAALLLGYTFVIGMSWPILEASVAGGGPPGRLGRRVAVYNIIWPAGGAVVIAIEGTLLKYWITGLFILPGLLHLLSILILVLWPWGDGTKADAGEALLHPAPEPALLHKRKLAVWLSRTALPATYTVIYGLMPMMPFLPVMKPLPTTLQTLLASVWLITRWLTFLILASNTWWHTRPRALLWAAVLMMLAFFGMTLRPTAGAAPALDMASMIFWQAVLGMALGMIYSGSLYFGMVLSKGSTEHGGYHEATIGFGWVIGPAIGVLGLALRPNTDPKYDWIPIAAVGGIIVVSVAGVAVTAGVMGRQVARND